MCRVVGLATVMVSQHTSGMLVRAARAVDQSEGCEYEGFRRLRVIVTGLQKKYLNTSVSSSTARRFWIRSAAPTVSLNPAGDRTPRESYQPI